ncbi:MAG: membrane dipeptidase [Ruminococcaceae bacterium]|nr:membrane dipeptidase [Oscillospiraceae bacterium]
MRLFDGHCDTPYELWMRGETLEQNSCHIDLQKTSEFGAFAQIFAFCSYAGTPMAHKRLLTEPLKLLKDHILKHSDRMGLADTAEQIRQLHAQGKAAALLSLEGAELIDCDPEQISELEHFSMCTLTWNEDNALAGCHLSDRGLTDLGRAFVHRAKGRMLIDVSHLGDRAFWDLLELTDAPILASHSNCRSLCPHSRNLTDDQLRQIAQTGGTVGLNLYVPFLGENANFETIRRHLEHMLRLCGEDHVALGGDLDGCDQLPQGFANVSSYLSLYSYLRGCGYDEALLDHIFYRNLLQLF